jgi:hypothetical protein
LPEQARRAILAGVTTNIHDSGYKKLFSTHTIFRQLVETFIQAAWVSEIDFNMQQVARIEDLQRLEELVNTLLDKAARFKDFTKLLTMYLPAANIEQ